MGQGSPSCAGVGAGVGALPPRGGGLRGWSSPPSFLGGMGYLLGELDGMGICRIWGVVYVVEWWGLNIGKGVIMLL